MASSLIQGNSGVSAVASGSRASNAQTRMLQIESRKPRTSNLTMPSRPAPAMRRG
jgi:hypothetical protein